MFDEQEIVEFHHGRADFLLGIILFLISLVVFRVGYLQVIKGEKLYRYSLENRLREEIVWAPRGKIFSRDDEILVNNSPRFDAIVTRQYLKNSQETFKNLSSIINVSLEDILKKIKRYGGEPRYRPIILKKNLSNKEIALIETQAEKLPGISVEVSISREYLNEEVGAHLYGYISEINSEQLPKYKARDGYAYNLRDLIGQAGIEKYFDLDLRGQNGREYVEVDALGRKRKYLKSEQIFSGMEKIEPLPGHSLRLSIDKELQDLAYELLQDKSGAVVGIDVETGEILTMLSSPAFKPSRFTRGLDKDYWFSLLNDPLKPLYDKTIQEHYSPGSTFKVVTALAGLIEEIVTPYKTYFCNGSLKLGRRTYHCWNKEGHGEVNLFKALRGSCNVYFQQIAKELDIDVLAEYATLLGFGKRTGISLPRETSGLIPTKAWKKKTHGYKWSKGETLSCAIGQSFTLTTILQLANAYATIANGGKLMKPFIVKNILDANKSVIKKFEPEIIKDINIEKHILDSLRRGLYEVVNHEGGTARRFIDPKVRLAGKTGTTQVVSKSKVEGYEDCEDLPYKYRHNALFAGFAPYEKPRIALAAIVEHGCSGGKAAGPIVYNLAKAYLKKVNNEKNIK